MPHSVKGAPPALSTGGAKNMGKKIMSLRSPVAPFPPLSKSLKPPIEFYILLLYSDTLRVRKFDLYRRSYEISEK